MGSSVLTTTLDNGLTVFLREKHDAPVASFWTWYRVGSRNELPGRTGISHWVEHMQFKGTPSLPKGAIFGEVSRHGGQLNAMTSLDWTAYYETLPVANLDLSLRIESDRMRNSIFDPEETERERTVILSERQGGENRPTYHLAEEVIGAAFQAHPYRHMVIGYERDLREISRDDLYGHYQRFYTPNNAFISAVGDFDSEELLARIEASFVDISAVHGDLPPVASEPPQRGERRVTLHRSTPAAYLMMGYRMPAATHPDIPALLVADAILSGAKAMGMGGGSAMGRSSRLYRSLVAKGLARSAGSSAGLHLDPHLWTFSATALPGVEPARIESAIEEEINRLSTSLASEEEFVKARKQIRAQYVYSRESVTAEAFWQGQMEIVDHAARIDTLADELAAVTPEDVQRVASTWLVPDQRTIGWQLPIDQVVSAGSGESSPVDQPANMIEPQLVWGLDGGNSHGFVRTELDNGIVLLSQARPEAGSISATISVAAGHASTGETTPGLAAMTGRMLNRGTVGMSFEQFNETVDGIGAVIGVESDREDISVSLHALAEDFGPVLDLAAGIILQPTFPADELETVRQQTLTGLREDEDDTGAMAGRALREQMYPEGHPYRLPTSGDLDSVAAMSRDALAAYHQASFSPELTTIAVVGGIRDHEAIADQVNRVLGSWRRNGRQRLEIGAVQPPDATLRKSFAIAGKSQADIVIGYPTIPRTMDKRYVALSIANVVLGQLGLMGRLGANVREEQGLAYYASSSLAGDPVSSVWRARAGVDPANVQRAIEAIVTELRRLRTDLVLEQELADAKSYVIGSVPIGLESQGGVVGLLLSIEQYGFGLDYLDRYPEIIRSLTRDDLLEAAHELLDESRLVIGVAGPEGAGTGA